MFFQLVFRIAAMSFFAVVPALNKFPITPFYLLGLPRDEIVLVHLSRPGRRHLPPTLNVPLLAWSQCPIPVRVLLSLSYLCSLFAPRTFHKRVTLPPWASPAPNRHNPATVLNKCPRTPFSLLGLPQGEVVLVHLPRPRRRRRLPTLNVPSLASSQCPIH